MILAGGASSRMGRPKALLPFAGETFLDRLTGVLERHCSPVIVVLGHQEEAIRAAIKRNPVLAVNPDPGRGQLSSLQCALALLPPQAEAFLFTPVDYPAILESTVAALVAALEHEPEALLAVPRCQGRRGHPVACRAALAREFLALPPQGQAREVVRRHADRTVYVDVQDAGVVTDVDDPEAYERLMEGARR